MRNRLALGTVQFGIPYGVANQQGKVSLNSATEILKYAHIGGINTLDTAIAYGDSENCLGQIGVKDWQVVSKLPELPITTNDVLSWARESVHRSLQRLQIPQLYGLLLHRPQQLLSPQGQELHNALNLLKQEGLVNKIGISIYSPTELKELFDRFAFDLVQAPFSILDHSLEKSGWLSRLKVARVEVHVRSIFLQGLLLMNSSHRPAYFNRWQPIWNEWEQWLHTNNLTALQACLHFVLSNHDIDRVVVGVDSLSQLQEILAATTIEAVKPPDKLCCDDPDLINPARWQLI
ncbi:aldo/keto reductase [Pseudanabaena sp. UWO310]|uniref:aldo/keto reductase n=1 Tax=Pseudanabaena sp. UWO310 TaxID=2480795 RepID=UPI001CC20E2E|nr:aldo/keto reductase [Pseudanabaena sp. UWO310]